MSQIPLDGGQSSNATREFLTVLFNKRNTKRLGHENIRNVELVGGTIIEPTAFEPDARTHRNEYYYNATNNILYRKIVTRNEPGIIHAYWKKISE